MRDYLATRDRHASLSPPEAPVTACDKCGTDVPPDNDATLLAVEVTGNPMLALAISRHLLPVKDGDTTVCEGSPSRAQYLPDMPRDPRYPYNEQNEALFRKAYEVFQAKCAAGGYGPYE